jgi:hypothetical protein
MAPLVFYGQEVSGVYIRMVYLFNTDVTLKNTEQVDSFGRLRVSNPVTLFDSQNRYQLNQKFFSNVIGSGSVIYIPAQSSANLLVTSTLNDFVARESRFVFNYQPGKSLLTMCTFVMNPAKSGLVQRVGYFGLDNGYYIQLGSNTSPTTLFSNVYIVERSNSLSTVSETVVGRESWNGDRLDGTGASGLTLDITKSHIFYTDIEWLGVGSVRIGVVINGTFINCHTFNHANIIPHTYITTACLPIRYEIFNRAATSGTSNLSQICSTVLSEGGYEPKEQLFCQLGPPAGLALSSTTRVPLISIRLAPGRLDAIAVIKQLNVAVATNTDLAQWSLILNGTLSGATSWGSHADSTNVQVDTGSTAITGGRMIEMGFAQTGSLNTSLQASFFEAQLGRNSFTQTSDIITLAGAQCTTNPKIFYSLAWAELI